MFITFAVPHQAEDVLNVAVDATNPDTHLDHHSPFRKVLKEVQVPQKQGFQKSETQYRTVLALKPQHFSHLQIF